MRQFLVVDDHVVVRRGCTTLLTGLCSPCEVLEAGSGEDALIHLRSQTPDLIIMDIHLPGISGIETATRIRRSFPNQKILFFSMYDDTAVVRRVLNSGCGSYVSKNAAPETFLDAVNAVLKGINYIEHSIAMNMLNGNESVLNTLSSREFEIFSMLANGDTTHKTADKLNLSTKTVSNYASTIRSKLGITTQAEMVHVALDAGLLAKPRSAL